MDDDDCQFVVTEPVAAIVNQRVRQHPVDAARVARLEAENRRLAEENAFLKKAAVNSTRQRNNASSLSAGVSKSRVFRGLEFNRAATASRSAWVRSFMLTPLGKY